MQYARPMENTPSRVTRSSHHVCFACRKTFKKPASTKQGWVVLDGATYPCPDCRQPMKPIGKNFRAPKQTDARAWRVAQRLFEAGFRFDSSHEGTVPTKKTDLDLFLASRIKKTYAQRLLEQYKRSP